MPQLHVAGQHSCAWWGEHPWRRRRCPLGHLPHVYPPSHTPQWCRGLLPTQRLNIPAQLARKIICRPADAGGAVLPEQEHMEGSKCLSSLHPQGSSGLSWCSLQAAACLRGEPVRGALCAGSSFQKRFFILTKSSIQTFPFCWKSLQTLAKPFPLIFLHLTKTTQTVCLQGRLSQDMEEESIICNARKYNLHISKAFSVKNKYAAKIGRPNPHCLQATVLSNRVSNSLSKPN